MVFVIIIINFGNFKNFSIIYFIPVFRIVVIIIIFADLIGKFFFNKINFSQFEYHRKVHCFIISKALIKLAFNWMIFLFFL